jgi:hypothetical protein
MKKTIHCRHHNNGLDTGISGQNFRQKEDAGSCFLKGPVVDSIEGFNLVNNMSDEDLYRKKSRRKIKFAVFKDELLMNQNDRNNEADWNVF